MFFALRTHLSHRPFASNATSCCYVTKWITITSTRTGQSPVQTVPACPVQIRAHHHIDVYTDINKEKINVLKYMEINAGDGNVEGPQKTH